MKAPNYTSTTQQRGYRTMKALFGHEEVGITTQELANKLNTSTDRVFKDLKNLEEAGFAEQLPNKQWRISPTLGRECFKIMNALDSARRRLDEAFARYGMPV